MDPNIYIIAAIAAGCVGFLLGFLTRSITRRKKKSDQETVSDVAAEPEPQEPTPAKRPPKRKLDEVASLWRERRSGRLVFQIEDHYYKRGDELTNRERQILLKVIMDFYRWLEPPSAVSSQLSAEDMPEPASEGTPEETIKLQDQGMEIPLEDSQEEEPDASENRFTPSTIVARALSSEVPVPPPPSPSMVAQVDFILQKKLHAADMEKWAVRLRESPSQGMVVLVGMEQYESIEDVPYERVRGIIRESVAEWEHRTEDSK